MLIVYQTRSKFYNKSIKRSEGFGLVGVLVFMGALSIMAVVFMRMMAAESRATNYIDAKHDEAEFARKVQLVLGEKSACFNSLSGKSLALGNYTFSATDEIQDNNGTRILRVGDKAGDLNSLEVVNVELENIDIPLGTGGVGDLYIKITTRRLKKVFGGDEITTAAVITATTNALGLIVSCAYNHVKVDAAEFCIGSVCRDSFSNNSCSSGELVSGINDDGTFNCININCPPGEVLRGLNPTTGNVQCDSNI